MLNRQLIFDTVVPKLLAQGGRSMGTRIGSMRCAYRGEKGRKCAVGHIIPDELYDRELEGCSAQKADVLAVLDPAYGSFSRLHDDHLFLAGMQRSMHDNLYNWTPEAFIEAAKNFATRWELKVDVNLFN